jgi:hypothetical protein
MTLLRFLPAFLLLCSGVAAAQQKPDPEEAQPKQFTLFPEHSTVVFPESEALTSFRPNLPVQFAAGPKSLPGDTLCYAIRSYVVARDSKHSDSVHRVGYTTCVPASRYRLRTTMDQQASEDDLYLIQR